MVMIRRDEDCNISYEDDVPGIHGNALSSFNY